MTGSVIQSIGLPIDNSNVLSVPPSVVLYGPPGVGKTTEMARAFPGVLYVQSSPSILHAFAHWAQQHPEEKLVVPQRVTLDERTVAEHFGNSVTMAVTNVVLRFVEACDKGVCPYEGIVFDEWNTLSERMFAELKSDPWGKFKGRNGNLNIFAVFDYFKAVHRMVLGIARRTRKMVGFVSHYQPPRVDDDENSPTKGSIKHPGGPKMPMGLSDQVTELCADADVVLQLAIKEAEKPGLMMLPAATAASAPAPGDSPKLDLSILSTAPAASAAPAATPAPAPALAPTVSKDAQRVFLTQLDPKWFRKVRGGFDLAPEETLDIKRGHGLRELLRRAGYPV